MTTSQRWQAVQSRDSAATSSFVYCVKTTGIYCRPDCKARLARRSNVEFHENALEAARMGFRPCKRCRPELTSWCPQTQMVAKACEVIRKSRGEGREIGLTELAKQVGMTKSHFHRVFRKTTGKTPREWDDQKPSEEMKGTGVVIPQDHISTSLPSWATRDELDEWIKLLKSDLGLQQDGLPSPAMSLSYTAFSSRPSAKPKSSTLLSIHHI